MEPKTQTLYACQLKVGKKKKDIHLSSFFLLLLFKIVFTLGPFSILSE